MTPMRSDHVTGSLLLASSLFMSPLVFAPSTPAHSGALDERAPVRPFVAVHDSTHAVEPVILQRIEEWRAAYNSGDLKTLKAFYAEESRYVSPHVVDLMISGRDAITANFGKGIAGGGHIDAITVLAAESSCDLAALVCRYDATNGGVKVSGKNILVMRRVDGRWLITTHASIVRD